jgi:hypothetical protein
MGNMWYEVLVEMATKMGYIQGLPSKHSGGTKLGVQKFWAYLKHLTRTDATISLFHSDDGKEFMGELDDFLLSIGATRTNTGGYAAKLNVIVEGRIKMLMGRIRAIMHLAMGDNDYFDELAGVALLHANHLINVNPWSNGKCPYESLTGIPYAQDRSDRVFGSLVLAYIKKEHRLSATKPVTQMAIYVGRSEEVPGAISVVPIAYDAVAQRWVLGAPEACVDYKIYEGFFPLRTQPKVPGIGRTLDDFIESTEPWFIHELIPPDLIVPARPVGSGAAVYEVDQILARRRRRGEYQYQVKWKGYDADDSTWEPHRYLENYGCSKLLKQFNNAYEKKSIRSQLCTARNDDPAGRTTRLIDEAFAALYDESGSPQPSPKSLLARHRQPSDEDDTNTNHNPNNTITEPGGQVYDTVLRLLEHQQVPLQAGESRDDQVRSYIPGYMKEKDMVTQLRLEPVSENMAQYIRTRKLAVRLKMLLEAKKDGRRKGRLVLQGFRAPAWWRVGAIDSPVVATATIRTLIFRRNQRPNEILSSFDFDLAFLQSDAFAPTEREKHVSFCPHPGYPEEIYKLKGPLYGSDDAPMRFFNTVAPWLTSIGFTQAKNDPCLFINLETGVHVGLHVDDGLVRATQGDTENFYKLLGQRFKYKTPTYLTPETPLQFVGLTIKEYTNEEGHLFRSIDCVRDTVDLLKTAGTTVPDIRKVKCPMPDTSEMVMDVTPLLGLEATWVRSVVGQLQFLATMVRYDISHAVSRLSQYSHNPTEGSRKALCRILGYLMTTVEFRIEGRVHGPSDHIAIYSDSDHASDKKIDTRSQTGIMILLNGVPCYWRSAKQPITALSSAEAEIYALSESVKHGRLFLWRCEEANIPVKWPMTIYVDNTQSKSFQNATCINSKLRGVFDLRDAWIQELRDKGQVETVAIPRKENKSDILTHCLSSGNFNKEVGYIQNHTNSD